MLIDRPFRELLGAFSSPDPTPGGGSASAMAGALGAALLVMVASLPKTRAGLAGEHAELDAAAAALVAARDRLLVLVDRDTEAYDAVVAAYRLAKHTDDEKAARRDAIQRALRLAIEAPLEVMKRANDAMAAGTVVARCGARTAESDIEVGLELVAVAARGARLNVLINLAGVADPSYADATRQEADALLQEIEARWHSGQ